MKSIIITLSAFFLSSLTVSSQNNKSLKAHQNAIKSSVKSKAALISRDSFYCSGDLKAVYKVTNRNRANDTVLQSFNSITTGTTLIIVNLVNDTAIGRYYNYSFPTLSINCDVLKKGSNREVFETICKHQLLNAEGIDTVKAQTFVTLKGNLKKKLDYSKFTKENFKVAERNKSAAISLTGQDIQQGSVPIGSMEELTVATPGGTVKQIKVYNTQKQLICIATQTNTTGREWRMLTNFDNKYHLLVCSSDTEDVYDILKLLIDKFYL